MNRTLLLLLIVATALGSGERTFAQAHQQHAQAPPQQNTQPAQQIGGELVRVISTQDIQEKVDGKDAAMTVVEVTIEPGQAGLPHRHPGPAFVYVLEGEYELGIGNEPTLRFKAGETFYEPTGCLHSVSKNPATKGRTRLIAVVLHPRDAKAIAIPEVTEATHDQ